MVFPLIGGTQATHSHSVHAAILNTRWFGVYTWSWLVVSIANVSRFRMGNGRSCIVLGSSGVGLGSSAILQQHSSQCVQVDGHLHPELLSSFHTV